MSATAVSLGMVRKRRRKFYRPDSTEVILEKLSASEASVPSSLPSCERLLVRARSAVFDIRARVHARTLLEGLLRIAKERESLQRAAQANWERHEKSQPLLHKIIGFGGTTYEQPPELTRAYADLERQREQLVNTDHTMSKYRYSSIDELGGLLTGNYDSAKLATMLASAQAALDSLTKSHAILLLARKEREERKTQSDEQKRLREEKRHSEERRTKALAAAHLGKTRDIAQSIRRKLLPQIRDSPYCPYCEILLVESDAVADHIYPVAKGGLSIAQNMVMICRVCNDLKSDKTLVMFCAVTRRSHERIVRTLRMLGKDP